MKKLLSLILLSSIGTLVHADDPYRCEWASVNHDIRNTRSNPCETILSPTSIKANGLTKVWFDGGANPLGGQSVQVAPLVVNNILYYGDMDGYFYAKNVADGSDAVAPFLTVGQISAPAIYNNGILYFTATPAYTSGPTQPLYLYAVNASNLVPLPSYPLAINFPEANNSTGQILAGPVLAGEDKSILIIAFTNADNEEDATFVPTFRGGWIAYDLTQAPGTVLWTLIPNANAGTGGGSFSTAAVDNKRGLMFAGTSNSTTPPNSKYTDALLAINYRTGEIVWSYQFTKNDVYSLPYACGYDLDLGGSPNLFTISYKGNKIDVVGAYNKGGIYRVFKRSNGKQIWCAPTTTPYDPSVNGSPGSAYANGTVYTLSNLNTAPFPVATFSAIGAYATTLGSFNAFLYFVSQSHLKDQSFIRALDANTGKIKWSINTTVCSFASITEANDVLYTGNFDGLFRALSAKDGSLLYSDYPSPAGPPAPPLNISAVDIGGPITVVNGMIFVPLQGLLGTGGMAMYQLAP